MIIENSNVGNFVQFDEKVKVFVAEDEIFLPRNFDEFNEKLKKLIELMNIIGFEVDGIEEGCMYEAWNDKGEKCIYSPRFETNNRKWKSKRKKIKKKEENIDK